MNPFGLLAALVPISASVWAASSFLAEQMRMRDEQRRRYRILRLVEDLRQRLNNAEMASGATTWDFEAHARKEKQIAKLSERLHEANGIESTNATYGSMAVQAAMSKPVEPISEVARQWIVLTGAVLGVAFLALDAIS